MKKNASETDLKREYRKLALQLHPDKCRAPGATEAFKGSFRIHSFREDRGSFGDVMKAMFFISFGIPQERNGLKTFDLIER